MIQNSSIKMRHTRQSARKSQPISVQPEKEIETHRALLNDVVLQNIFKYLGYKDLKSCRKVGNCQWLRNSKKAWWSRSKVVFECHEKLEDIIEDYLNEADIASNATNYNFGFIDKGLNRFWDSLGHSIKHLEIYHGRFPSVEDFRRIIYTQLPNLEKMVLWRVRTGAESDNDESPQEPMKWQNPQFEQQTKLKYFELRDERFPVSWLEFLSHFPNLQVLLVRASNDDILKAISIIRKHDAKMLKLKEVKIYGLDGQYDESIRSVYSDPKLTLEKLSLDFDYCQPKTVEAILTLHANSLKEVCVKNDYLPNHEPLSMREPLPHLEKLEIKNCVFTADIFKCIPSVRKVKLEYEQHFVSLLPEAGSNLSINSCKELSLRIHRRHSDAPGSDLAFFLNIFPNLEIFEANDLNNMQFSSICGRWTKLRNFKCIYYCLVDATGLLGYDPESNASNGARNPNITNLKDLQSFLMECRDRLEMKNGSVILKELEKLPHLKKFELKRYKLKEENIWTQIFAKYSGK